MAVQDNISIYFLTGALGIVPYLSPANKRQEGISRRLLLYGGAYLFSGNGCPGKTANCRIIFRLVYIAND